MGRIVHDITLYPKRRLSLTDYIALAVVGVGVGMMMFGLSLPDHHPVAAADARWWFWCGMAIIGCDIFGYAWYWAAQ